jgi:hypothetical protein
VFVADDPVNVIDPTGTADEPVAGGGGADVALGGDALSGENEAEFDATLTGQDIGIDEGKLVDRTVPEIAQEIQGHVDSKVCPVGRQPNVDEIENALVNGTMKDLPRGRIEYSVGKLRVIVNTRDPINSTAYFKK